MASYSLSAALSDRHPIEWEASTMHHVHWRACSVIPTSEQRHYNSVGIPSRHAGAQGLANSAFTMVQPATLSRSDVAFHSGIVYTLDNARLYAEAFVVSSSGTFRFIGSTSEVLDIASAEGLATIDLDGRFVMPGIHDAHVHLLRAGRSHLNMLSLGDGIADANIGSRLREAHVGHSTMSCGCGEPYVGSVEWVVADLMHFPNFDRKLLDTEFPDTPVLMNAGADHAMYLNTTALLRSGYDLEVQPDPPGGSYVRRTDGAITGELIELAMTKAALAKPKVSLVHAKHCILIAQEALIAAGVTSIQEAATNTLTLQALRELDKEGKLKLHVYTHIVYKPEHMAEEAFDTLHDTLDKSAIYRSAHVHTQFVKFILDGIPLPPFFTQAALLPDGSVDESKIQIDDLAAAVSRFDARGMTCKIHCAGQGSTRFALDVYEQVRACNPDGPKHEIAHCNAIHPG
jgi:predicted amidohydrolase YtcJ